MTAISSARLTQAPLWLRAHFARYPIGPVRWHWFVVLSFAGGLAFSLPLYYWLNVRQTSVRGG